MAKVIIANSVEIQDFVRPQSFRQEENVTLRMDTVVFTYRKYGSRTYIPVVGHVVTVVDGATTIFGGTIIKITKRIEGVDILSYEIQCKDYTHLLDTLLVAKVYESGESIKEIVDDLVANHFPAAITGTNVDAAAVTTIEKIAFDYDRPSDVLTRLADMIQFEWWIDESKDLHFVPKGITSAAFDLTDTNGNYDFKTLVLKEDDTQLRNTVYVKGGSYVGPSRVDRIAVGDGIQKRFILPYKYSKKPGVKVNSVSQTVGIENLDDPASFDVLWNYNEKILVFDTSPPNTEDVEVTGTPEIPLLLKRTAQGSVSDKGAYEFLVNERQIKSKEEARGRATAEIDSFSETLIVGSFTTKKAGLSSGARIRIQSTIRGIDDFFFIQKIVTTFRNPNEFQYQIFLTTTETFEIIEFFRQLLLMREQAIGVPEDEDVVVDLLIDLQDVDKVEIAELLEISKGIPFRDTVETTDKILRAAIDSPPTWVWGTYAPTDDPPGSPDRKRPPLWDRGAVWA